MSGPLQQVLQDLIPIPEYELLKAADRAARIGDIIEYHTSRTLVVHCVQISAGHPCRFTRVYHLNDLDELCLRWEKGWV